MKKQKLYFSDFDDETAYTLDYIVDEMTDNELDECKVSLAIRETKTDYFYCKAVQEVYMKPPDGEPCGKECLDYEPRNGKNGCCKHRGFCYEPSEQKYILKLNGKLSLL
jgi:hypothetical protein